MKLKIVTLIAVFLIYSAPSYAFFDWTDEDAISAEQEFEGNYAGKVSMNYEFLDEDILKISVQADDMIVPVLGVAFHLQYQTLNLQFLKYEPGDFLERGGDPFYLVQDDSAYSRVVFGETLKRSDSFPTGSGKVVDIYFQVLSGNEFEFSFVNAVVSNLDTVRQDIDRIEWVDLKIEKEEIDRVASGGNVDLNLSSVLDSEATLAAISLVGLFSVTLMIVLIRKYMKLKNRFG